MTSTSDEVGHTPVPWSISKDGCIREGIDGHRYIPLASAFIEDAFNGDKQAITNAAFIVRACNSHDSLVKALEEIANHPTGGVGCNPVSFVETARAALSQAKGGK